VLQTNLHSSKNGVYLSDNQASGSNEIPQARDRLLLIIRELYLLLLLLFAFNEYLLCYQAQNMLFSNHFLSH
jgi:hypothetical protein